MSSFSDFASGLEDAAEQMSAFLTQPGAPPCPADKSFDPDTGACEAHPALVVAPSCPPADGREQRWVDGRCVSTGACAAGFRAWHGSCAPECGPGTAADMYGGCKPEGEECGRDRPAPGHVWRVSGGECVEAGECYDGFAMVDGRCEVETPQPRQLTKTIEYFRPAVNGMRATIEWKVAPGDGAAVLTVGDERIDVGSGEGYITRTFATVQPTPVTLSIELDDGRRIADRRDFTAVPQCQEGYGASDGVCRASGETCAAENGRLSRWQVSGGVAACEPQQECSGGLLWYGPTQSCVWPGASGCREPSGNRVYRYSDAGGQTASCAAFCKDEWHVPDNGDISAGCIPRTAPCTPVDNRKRDRNDQGICVASGQCEDGFVPKDGNIDAGCVDRDSACPPTPDHFLQRRDSSGMCQPTGQCGSDRVLYQGRCVQVGDACTPPHQTDRVYKIGDTGACDQPTSDCTDGVSKYVIGPDNTWACRKEGDPCLAPAQNRHQLLRWAANPGEGARIVGTAGQSLACVGVESCESGYGYYGPDLLSQAGPCKDVSGNAPCAGPEGDDRHHYWTQGGSGTAACAPAETHVQQPADGGAEASSIGASARVGEQYGDICNLNRVINVFRRKRLSDGLCVDTEECLSGYERWDGEGCLPPCPEFYSRDPDGNCVMNVTPGCLEPGMTPFRGPPTLRFAGGQILDLSALPAEPAGQHDMRNFKLGIASCAPVEGSGLYEGRMVFNAYRSGPGTVTNMVTDVRYAGNNALTWWMNMSQRSENLLALGNPSYVKGFRYVFRRGQAASSTSGLGDFKMFKTEGAGVVCLGPSGSFEPLSGVSASAPDLAKRVADADAARWFSVDGVAERQCLQGAGWAKDPPYFLCSKDGRTAEDGAACAPADASPATAYSYVDFRCRATGCASIAHGQRQGDDCATIVCDDGYSEQGGECKPSMQDAPEATFSVVHSGGEMEIGVEANFGMRNVRVYVFDAQDPRRYGTHSEFVADMKRSETLRLPITHGAMQSMGGGPHSSRKVAIAVACFVPFVNVWTVARVRGWQGETADVANDFTFGRFGESPVLTRW